MIPRLWLFNPAQDMLYYRLSQDLPIGPPLFYGHRHTAIHGEICQAQTHSVLGILPTFVSKPLTPWVWSAGTGYSSAELRCQPRPDVRTRSTQSTTCCHERSRPRDERLERTTDCCPNDYGPAPTVPTGASGQPQIPARLTIASRSLLKPNLLQRGRMDGIRFGEHTS